jgi:rRNA maturation endonuclease Nob1
MSWAQRLKRVFQLDLSQCEHCGGKTKIIATLKTPP